MNNLEVSFYHTTVIPVIKAIPRLLEKVVTSGMKAIVHAESQARLEEFNTTFWTYNTRFFLPHGTKEDGYTEWQPIYLTSELENPINAEIIISEQPISKEFVSGFKKFLYMFDGNDTNSLQQARDAWCSYKKLGVRVSYWKQSLKGNWESES